MVVSECRRMEASTCSNRAGWRSNPMVRTDAVDDNLVNRVPVIVPCYNGKSLHIHEELVVNGLSAISIRHHKGNCSEPVNEKLSEKDRKERGHTGFSEISKKQSVAELPVCLEERMKRRNSFWNMHRPELSKLTWPQNFVSSAMLQDFFHHHLRTHGTFCEPLHLDGSREIIINDELRDYVLIRDLVPPLILPPDEKAISIMEKSRSVQLNDEDLDPEIMVHKSRAEFCVTIGEHLRKPMLRRSTSQQIHKSGMQSAGRLETLPKDDTAEEVVSSVVSDMVNHTATERGLSMAGEERKTGPEAEKESIVAKTLGSGGGSDQVTEDGGDPARLRTILSPREEANGASDSK